MYIARRNEEKDQEKILAFIREHSFAILVSVMNGMPVATHIPLVLEQNGLGENVLTGHISKGNDQKSSLYNGAKVLCIFQGPHAYISPRWYTQLNVPTWNYISVHVYGTVRLIEGDELKSALTRMINNYEQHLPTPVQLEEIPVETFEADFRGIIGFEIRIDEMQAAAKLSQNRDEESFDNVIEQLEHGGSMASEVAKSMKEKRSQLFKDR